jgi:hypothetical protein
MDRPRFTQARHLFSRTSRVDVHVRAPGSRVWQLLTDAPGFPRWNSTVARIDGEIREGATLILHLPGSGRTRKPRVSGVVPGERMTWTGGLARVFREVRTFLLKPCHDGSTDFTMVESVNGLLFPLARTAMRDCASLFERYAEDLKRAAEGVLPAD